MTLNIHIDGHRAIELLAHQVKDHEGFEYRPFITVPSCRYEHDGSPSCLIGKAFAEAGVPLEILKQWDRVPPWDDEFGQIDGTAIDEVIFPEGLTVTAKAMAIFRAAQRSQDLGNSWGEAFQSALQAAAMFGPEK